MGAAFEYDTAENEILVLQEAARLIGRATEPEQAIGGVLRLLSQLLGLNRGRVILPDPASGTLTIAYAYGLTEEEKRRGVYALGEGVTGQVMRTGQAAVIQDIDQEPLYLTRAVDRASLPDETVAYLAAPILQDERPGGVLAVNRLRNRSRPFRSDLAVLQVVATIIGQILKIHALIASRTVQLESENRYLKGALASNQGAGYGLLGESPALKNALRHVQRVANTPATVLLMGESGTGKEKFARMLHLVSDRRDGAFVAINCAAIPENLMESELFGHEKGSFTGASHTKPGKVELASGGTLFLDEIGDLDLELQGKLLRVLEEQVIQRVGGTREVAVNVRIVTATHKNLQEAVNAGRFRLDLFYRLNVFPIHLPPLRERPGDVRLLARHFVNAANQEYHRNSILGPGVLERLEAYSWPGNIRQLENVIKRAVLLSGESTIPAAAMEQILLHEAGVNPASPGPATEGGYGNPRTYLTPGGNPVRPYARVRQDEAESITRALRDCGGNKTRAAISLGMTPRQFRYRMLKLGLELPP